MSRRIAVALDFSSESEFACEWALKNFYRPEDSLDLINCDDDTGLSNRLGILTAAENECNAARTTKKIEDLADKLEGKKIPFTVHFLRGDPKELIVALTENIKPDVLVMGSRGLGVIKRTLLGSVSDHCIHHCNCPVLIVRIPEEGEKSPVAHVD